MTNKVTFLWIFKIALLDKNLKLIFVFRYYFLKAVGHSISEHPDIIPFPKN